MTPGICSQIKHAAMEKYMSFPAKIHAGMLCNLYRFTEKCPHMHVSHGGLLRNAMGNHSWLGLIVIQNAVGQVMNGPVGA